MGLFRRKDERAIPQPGTPEFDQAVQGSALPDSSSGRSASMGESGWSKPEEAQAKTSGETMDLRGTGKRDEVEEVLREHGIDPDEKGQTIDASEVPGLRGALLKVLFGRVPNTDGFGGGIPAPKQDPPDQREAGADAESEAQKREMLGE
jgi:hypothetical protein